MIVNTGCRGVLFYLMYIPHLAVFCSHRLLLVGLGALNRVLSIEPRLATLQVKSPTCYTIAQAPERLFIYFYFY